MSNKKQQKEQQQQQADKVKAVRLYKIGSYQPENTLNDNVDYNPRYNNRRVQFNDPRDFYFNPYQFVPYMPPGNFNPNFPPISDFSYQRRRNVIPPHAAGNLRNQYYSQGNSYYNNWNENAPYLGSPGYYLNQYDEEDEDDDEDIENDGDDEDTDQNTEEDEEEEEEEDDDDDDDEEEEEEDDDEDEKQQQKVEVKKEPQQNKNDAESKNVNTAKAVEIKKGINTDKKENEPILKKIIDSAPSTPKAQLRKLSATTTANPTPSLPPILVEPSSPPVVQSSQQQQPKSILINENNPKQPEETQPKTSQPPVIRMMPIKPTTKKVVKITTAEVVDAPYKVEKPMSPDTKAKFLRKSSIDSTKSNEDFKHPSKEEINDDSLNKTPEVSKTENEEINNASKEEIKEEEEDLNKTPEISKTEHEETKQETSIETQDSSVEYGDKTQSEIIDSPIENKTNENSVDKPKKETETREDDDQIDDPITSSIKEEQNEENTNLYEKNFKITDIEVLPTITEIVPLKEENPEENLEKKAENKTKEVRKSSKKSEAPKPIVKERKQLPVSPVKQSNEKLNKQSFAISKPIRAVKASLPGLVSTSKVDKTVKKLHDFIESNQSNSKLEEEKSEEVESTKSTNSLLEDNLFLKERENSTFFGRISKLEVPALISTSITPAPPLADEYENQISSDTDQRINEIIEENRSDLLFRTQEEQFYREEITELKPSVKSNANMTKKIRKKVKKIEKFRGKRGNLTKAIVGLPNKFTSQFLLKRAYSDLSKSNLPALSQEIKDKSREIIKLKQEDDDNKNELKFPSLVMSEKLEEYKSSGNNSAAHHLSCRKYLDQGFKRCPCLMHNRLYYEDITNKIAPDVESYEMRPCSVKGAAPEYGERQASMILHKLKAVNEVLLSENEFSSQDYEINFSRNNSHLSSDKLHRLREPWNNAF